MKFNIFSKTLLTAIVFTTAFQASAQENPTGINLANMDTSVSPKDDFFQFVNGTWLKNTEIPADKTSWGSFIQLYEKTNKDALAILQKSATNAKYTSNTDQGKAINLYKTAMDTVARNRKGINPIKPLLAKIDAVKNIKDLQKLLMDEEAVGGNAGFFGIGIESDDKDSNKNVVSLNVGTLGLPDRDYYVSDEKDSKEKREKYQVHVARMLEFTGEKPEQAKKDAAKILALEIEMSQPRLDRVQRRDPKKQYNPTSIADLQKMTPFIDWNSYLNGIGITKIDTILVKQPAYMVALQQIYSENNVDAWKAYLRWMLIRRAASQLSTNIETANWEFYGKTLGGTLKESPRDEKALNLVNGNIGEALGKLYVEQMFPAEAKAKAANMIENIILAYESRINNLSWMSEATKIKAIKKLNTLNVKIGYPDKWKDYSKLVILSPEEGGSLYGNIQNIKAFNWKEDLEKLGKPVDKTEWGMSPQTVNAYYNPSYNEIVFPAAILQPPFYDYKADAAVNYGGIGAVIGHEISHGFDDQGAQYNAEGNLVDWWTADDLTSFTALGGTLANQYSALEPLPGIYVDGKFTLGENIGDLGGVNAAYDGLQLYLKANKNPGLIDGFTPDQRFFISWATVWRSKTRDEALKSQVKVDPHAPDMYRAYVPLLNVETFYKAFDIKKGDGMYVDPSERVIIW